ncbi:restriction endonuclease subunit S [Mycoplasmopsis felis]|uniref:restriction endonuclease subunit S n=1 Tax=Mycoplasmopsis felis TaxID=33923 RepID=UPI0021AFB1C3|nr:restriction endonuclease subunit S [Mycoplasmopsis felis]UWW01307.1 restriction endonuclease subunit S [Mycoplasmopsis felis]
MKKVLVPKVRFKGFDEEWKEVRISNILTYVQPWKYLTKKKNFDMLGYIPVLTANKSLLLGYSVEDNYYNKECIIFDDFTQDFKYINYPFLLKSSAIKILIPNNNYSISFIFFLFQSLRFESQGHARHYISYVQKKLIRLPSTNEANKIIKLLDQISNLITLEEIKLNKLKQLKETLLEKMFPEGNSKTPKIRFRGFEGEWEEERISNILTYVQPWKYLTKKKNFDMLGDIPVLTANKSLLLGYSVEDNYYNKECIIFDDFTQDFKHINYPFLLKSSAIKILIPNNNYSISFIFFLFQSLRFESQGHKTLYILCSKENNKITINKWSK